MVYHRDVGADAALRCPRTELYQRAPKVSKVPKSYWELL